MPKKKSTPKKDQIKVEPIAQPPVTAAPLKGKSFKGIVATGLMLCVGVLMAVIAYFGFEYYYADRIYPGITLGNQVVGGQFYNTAAESLNSYKAELENTGLQFTYDSTTVTFPVDADGVSLLSIDTDASVQNAYRIGRSGDTVADFKAKAKALLMGTTVGIEYSLATEAIVEQLKGEFDDQTTPYENAALEITGDDITVTKHKDGNSFQWDAVMAEVSAAVAAQESIDLALSIQPEAAPVTTAEAEGLIPDAKAIMDLAPITFTYEDNNYTIEADELATWLVASSENDQITLALDEEMVRASLATIAGEIDVPVKEGKFSLDIVDGEVQLTQFENGQDGLGVNMDKMFPAIQTALLDEQTNTIELIVEVTTPRATPSSLDDLGIKELLGTGTTNFAGSPYNRILNIHKGADMLNGLLIAPGETFSLLDILNPIDTAHGWYSELVIKGDKLEKEAGGGLCQVGSTSFRAAMLSGLPIVERRNHSWAISYYAYKGKAGVDATIYDPSPDFKFLNDTGHYILWRSRIEGSDIYFELWGTSDGRKGYFTDPVNSNYVSPGATIETVDESAAPGSRVCDGHAFTGVTASFDYIVERADGTVDTETFTSVYKARPQMCVVGPDAEEETTEEISEDTEETTEETETETNTNTGTNTNSNTNTNSGKNKNKNKNN